MRKYGIYYLQSRLHPQTPIFAHKEKRNRQFINSLLPRTFGPSAVPINYDTFVLSDKDGN